MLLKEKRTLQMYLIWRIIKNSFTARRQILYLGDREYEIICDDEGLSKRPALVSAVNNDGQPMLVGNLIVMGNSGGDEDMHEISFDEIQHLKKHFMHVVTKGSGPIHHYTLLCDVEFI